MNLMTNWEKCQHDFIHHPDDIDNAVYEALSGKNATLQNFALYCTKCGFPKPNGLAMYGL